ncbi:MAG: thermonuclease family protein [Mariniblastus sp.]|nr:thermonuclease family protein [Mariniblastus sp.]
MSSPSTRISEYNRRYLPGNLLTGFLLLMGLAGCGFYQDEYGNRKRVPAPPPAAIPYELSGNPYAIKQGDELQIVSGEIATYCRLIGVRAPSPDDPFFEPSVQGLNRLVEGQVVRGTVYRHDAHMRALFHARVGDLDLNRQMILNGWARYDETEFPGNESFRQAEAEARRSGRGLWQTQSAD